MKKRFVQMFILVLTLGFAACSEEKTPETSSPITTTTSSKQAVEKVPSTNEDKAKPTAQIRQEKPVKEPGSKYEHDPIINNTEVPYPDNILMVVEEEIYDVTEVEAEFPGGMEAMFNFLKVQISYPADAKENNIQGKVYVRFVVRKNGAITDVQLLRGIYPSINREALRVIKSMPNWKPGLKKGEPVSSRITLPVQFLIGD